MGAKENLTGTAAITAEAREIDFVTRFAKNWEHLRDIMGIMRPIRKTPGYVLKSKEAVVTLSDGNVAEGEDIPYSKATVVETDYEEMAVEKYAKAVSIEAIKDHGYDVAVQMTDDAFLFELQTNVTNRFYKYLNTGTLAIKEGSWQRALAMAKGAVINRFKQMHRTASNVVGFVNVLDLYDYLGDKDITVQSEFGFDYVQNFMGYGTVFLLSDEEIARGRVIATPVENIVNYYIDPSDSDFSRAGLTYATDGDTNLVGFHTQGNYNTAVSECFAIMGLVLFAEYRDAIAVATVTSDSVKVPDQTHANSKDYGEGKTVADFITPDTVISKDGKVTGTLKYVDSISTFKGNEAKGNFLPLILDEKYKGRTFHVKTEKNPDKTSTDLEWLFRVSGNDWYAEISTPEDGLIMRLDVTDAVLEQQKKD